jgi:hypothetical protein
MVLPVLRDSCLFVVRDGRKFNFSAIGPIKLKLGGDLGLVYQISVHVLVSRFDCFSYCKQTKEQKTSENRENLENQDYRKLEISPPFQV